MCLDVWSQLSTQLWHTDSFRAATMHHLSAAVFLLCKSAVQCREKGCRRYRICLTIIKHSSWVKPDMPCEKSQDSDIRPLNYGPTFGKTSTIIALVCDIFALADQKDLGKVNQHMNLHICTLNTPPPLCFNRLHVSKKASRDVRTWPQPGIET